LIKRPLTIKIHDMEEFDEEMLRKALKVIEGKEGLIEVKKLSEGAEGKKK